jgi:hypothetical protein
MQITQEKKSKKKSKKAKKKKIFSLKKFQKTKSFFSKKRPFLSNGQIS